MNTHRIRTMTHADEDAIDALLDRSFGSLEEVHLIHALRDSGEMVQEQVMELDGTLIGYAALSAMVEPLGWLCLAPVAVAPAFQGKGYGLKLVQNIGMLANQLGRNVVVLGKPSFYEAGGFSNVRAANLTSPYPIEFTSLAGVEMGAPTATLVYPSAFEKLS